MPRSKIAAACVFLYGFLTQLQHQEPQVLITAASGVQYLTKHDLKTVFYAYPRPISTSCNDDSTIKGHTLALLLPLCC